MDPPEPIHGVIGVDRALSLRVTVRELPLPSCWEATLLTPQILQKYLAKPGYKTFVFKIYIQITFSGVFQMQVSFDLFLLCSILKCLSVFFLFKKKYH